jgi:MAF protein
MLVLASNSPRRKQLLSLTGWSFEVRPAEVNEATHPSESPSAYVRRLAESKARAVGDQSPANGIILAADTTVIDGSDILGKPLDKAQAEAMLLRLRGRVHQVYTALAIYRVSDGFTQVDCCASDVPMRNYSLDEIQKYIDSGDPMDKAGAYAIQHLGFHPVDEFDGCFANVMGLPLCHVQRNMKRIDLEPEIDLPAACQLALEYECPVFKRVLRGEM